MRGSIWEAISFTPSSNLAITSVFTEDSPSLYWFPAESATSGAEGLVCPTRKLRWLKVASKALIRSFRAGVPVIESSDLA
jgi:hypothetical protein